MSNTREKADLTVVLTVWKRNHLEEQLAALAAQTVQPGAIWVIQYGEHVPTDEVLKKHPAVHRIHSTLNLKYFGRFSVALHADTRYTWVLDDDIIPSPAWVETCIRTCEMRNAIVCSNGRIIPPGDYAPEMVKGDDYLGTYFIGDSPSLDLMNLCQEDTIVDFGCSSYFFKTEWLRYFWQIWPHTFQTGEDMHLSASCKILGNVATVVPRQHSARDSGNVTPAYSCDQHASWRKAGFVDKRSYVLKYLVEERNWCPILWGNLESVRRTEVGVPV